MKPDDISTYLNLTEALIITDKPAEAEEAARQALKLAQSTEDKALSNYLLAISLKLQGKDTRVLDEELERLCAEEFKAEWSFEEIEDWLKEAEISPECQVYIRQKTEMLKRHGE